MLIANSYSFLLIRSRRGYPDFSATPIASGANLDQQSANQNQSKIDDGDKRAFIKALGVAGVGVAAVTLLPNKAHALIMGSSPTTGVVGVKNSTNTRVNPATEETAASLLKTSDLNFDGSGYLNVNVQTTSASGGGSSFSDSGDVSRLALVDGDRHVQVDVLSSTLPTTASTETTLQTISFGGVKYALRMVTSGVYDYVGEAPVGTLDSADDWRIKRIQNTASGLIITWAGGTSGFNHIWDDGAGTDYTDPTYS